MWVLLHCYRIRQSVQLAALRDMLGPLPIISKQSSCLQKQDDLCSHYRKWLTAVAECAKALTDSKVAVATAEAEVKVMPRV